MEMLPSQLVLGSQHRPLAVKQIRYSEFLHYPLCGGFSYRSLLPRFRLA